MKKFDRSLAMLGYGPGPGNPVLKSDAEREPRYPCFHYEGPEELDLPREGKMVVEFCVKREVEEEEEGKHWYRCDVEIKRIVSVEATKEEDDDDQPTRRNNDTEEALDALMEARENEGEEE